jgi:hypothetical protein
VKLSLAPAEGVFVVFTKGSDKSIASPTGAAPRGSGALAASVPLCGWTLSFPADWGAPASIKLENLASWTDLPLGEEGRHFSTEEEPTSLCRCGASKSKPYCDGSHASLHWRDELEKEVAHTDNMM